MHVFTYFEYDSSNSTNTLGHKDRAGIQRTCLDRQNLASQSNGISIRVLGLGVLSRLLIQSGPASPSQ